jgi:hypothetical protein
MRGCESLIRELSLKKHFQLAFSFLGALAVIATAFSTAGYAQQRDKPRLVLQVTVDQLRGDLPGRYYNRLGEGGFRTRRWLPVPTPPPMAWSRTSGWIGRAAI